MQINKDIIKKRFSKSLYTYRENAIMQNEMAEKITKLINEKIGKNFKTIYEIGFHEGLLTEKIMKTLNYSLFYANDIIEESEEIAKKLGKDIIFQVGDIEEVALPKNIDLIVSNAVFQWIENLDKLMSKIALSLSKDGYLVFSTFGKENLKEIRETTGIGLEYKNISVLKELLGKYFSIIYEEEYVKKLYFKNSLEVLRHLSLTGTNALSYKKWRKSDIRRFEENYEKCKEEKGFPLTYDPIILILKPLIY